MEIKCSKSIGNWFDDLSVFNVKINLCNGDNKNKNISNFQNLAAEIKEYIGVKLFDEIMHSDEYRELYAANLHTFNKVNEAQKSTGLAKEVDESNKNRFFKKNLLQQKFFGSQVKEIKV